MNAQVISYIKWLGSFSKIKNLLVRSPAILTSNDFVRSNEIVRTKWPIYQAIHHFVLMISSKHKKSS